jgi:hypothetical protein
MVAPSPVTITPLLERVATDRSPDAVILTPAA